MTPQEEGLHWRKWGVGRMTLRDKGSTWVPLPDELSNLVSGSLMFEASRHPGPIMASLPQWAGSSQSVGKGKSSVL